MNLFRTMLATLALCVLSQSALAGQFPFEVVRDANGKLEKIVLPERAARQMVADGDILAESKAMHAQMATPQVSMMMQALAVEAKGDQDKKDMLADSQLALANEVEDKDFDDPKLQEQYAEAKAEITKTAWFRLLAAPYYPQAFDEEKIVAEVIKKLISKAQNILDPGGPLQIFTYLVSEYFEALQSRREFYQNQMIYLVLNSGDTFTAEEKNYILSSVFYSRLSLFRLDKRHKALKHWAEYGVQKYADKTKRCKDFVQPGDTAWGTCFKVVGNTIANQMIRRQTLSKKPSIAFDYESPKSVRNFRALLLIIKLGAKFVPSVGPVKSLFIDWIDSFYKDQRKSEGFLYGQLIDQNNASLADWILVGSANPLIRR
jgi:hypothetical protein